jgi:hypothetical protein
MLNTHPALAELRANWVKPGGARTFSGRRQPSCDDTSRMNREVHVRICERLGVKFPGPTRQLRTFRLPLPIMVNLKTARAVAFR